MAELLLVLFVLFEARSIANASKTSKSLFLTLITLFLVDSSF